MSEQMQSAIADLNNRLENLDDPRAAFAMVRDRIEQYRKVGWSIPEDLQMLERQILAECWAESQGR